MAVGDVFSAAPTSTANNSFLDIQPSAGVEAVIHNLYYGGAAEFYWYDGTNSIKFGSDASGGSLLAVFLHVTNSKWVRIKNVAGTTQYLGYDGVQSK
jgi:hypothetical protein